jgi:hypothetical protein
MLDTEGTGANAPKEICIVYYLSRQERMIQPPFVENASLD